MTLDTPTSSPPFELSSPLSSDEYDIVTTTTVVKPWLKWCFVPWHYPYRLKLETLAELHKFNDHNKSNVSIRQQHQPQPPSIASPKFFKRSHITTWLTSDICENYRACGVLVLATNPKTKKRMMLLGHEDRTKRVGRHQTPLGYFWLHFQGKRDPEDQAHPGMTAYREFVEETGGVFSAYHEVIRKQIYDPSTPKVWCPTNRYVLYVIDVPYNPRIPQHFTMAKHTRHIEDNYQLAMQWVCVYNLYQWIRSPNVQGDYTLNNTNNAQDRLYPFFCTLLNLKATRKLVLYNKRETLYTCDFVDDWRVKKQQRLQS